MSRAAWQARTAWSSWAPGGLLNELQALHRELAAKTEALDAQGRKLDELRRRLEAVEARAGRVR